MSESVSESGSERRRVSAARQLSRVRRGETTRFAVAEQKGYVTTGRSDDGRLEEVVIRMAKQGSTLAGTTDAVSQAISLGLQAGAPLETYVSELADMRFPPAGRTDDPELPTATSIMDYVARRLAVDDLPSRRRGTSASTG